MTESLSDMKPSITDITKLDLKKTYTYADYLTWQFNERVELIKGWIYKMSPAPKRIHQQVETALSSKLWTFFENEPCQVYNSPFDVRLLKNKGQADKEIESVVQPDVCVVCDMDKLDERGCVGAPDLIVEVLSTSTMKKDYNEKFNLYQENGVKEYWLVHPETKAVQIFYLEGQNYLEFETYERMEDIVRSKLFPELAIPASSIFKA